MTKKKSVEDIYPLTPMQQGILFETLYSLGAGIHIEQLMCTVRGDLDISAFERAWQRVVDRHAVLRTAFVWKDLDEPLQVVLRRVKVPLGREDWRELSPATQQEKLAAYLAADRQRGFDLTKPPLMHLALFQTAEDAYQLLWSHNHILMDGWCGPILLKEFLTFYKAFTAGKDLELPKSPPYSDYVKWLKQQDLSRAEAFWKRTLQGFTEPTPLGVAAESGYPFDPKERYGEHRASLPAKTTAALKSLAQENHITLYTLVQGVWALLLSRYSGKDDVVFGTTASGRPLDLPGMDSAIGLFINTLPVRVKLPLEASLWSWLNDIHAYNVEMQQYEYSTGGQVHVWSEVPASLPLYESLLVFENYPVDLSILESSGLTVDLANARSKGSQTNFALTFLVIASSELMFHLVYDGRRLDRENSGRILEHFLDLLRAMAANLHEDVASMKGRISMDRIPRVRPLPRRVHPQRAADFVAPRTPAEATLAGIWAEVFDLPRVGIYDNFFDLGGYSLLALQLFKRVREAFPLELPLRSLLEEPNIAGLAKLIDAVGRGEDPARLADMTFEDLSAEAVCDPTISRGSLPLEPFSEPDAILLTGATGFLGSYLLHELLQKTQAKIFCLVRAESRDEGRKRLQKKLEAYSLWNGEQADRIVPVIGDFSLTRLGLSGQDYEDLAQKVDVVYHNGAWVSDIFSYATLKATNVLGTQEILRLAIQKKLKIVHYISSIAVFPLAGYKETKVVREEDDLDHGERLYGGYAQSKWVAEKLVSIARSRGLPVTVYRPGLISGHSQSGLCETDNLMCTVIKGCVQFGSVPDVESMVDLTPVDYVSKAIIHLSRQRESLNKVFHLANPRPTYWSQIVNWIRSFGYPLRQLPVDEWQAEVLNQNGYLTGNALYSRLPLLADRMLEDGISGEQQFPKVFMPHYDCRQTLEGLEGTSIECPPVDAKLLDTYLAYFVESGFLHAPGRESTRVEGGGD